MEAKEKLAWLKFLSDTHRTEFNERRKHEWKALLSLLTFYALCAASVLSDRFEVPDSVLLILAIWLVFLLVAGIAGFFLMDLHSANNINKVIAQNCEHAIVDIINGNCPKTSRTTLIPGKDEKKEQLQIRMWDLFKRTDEPKVGIWACRAQVSIVLLFAIAGAFFVTAIPKSTLENVGTSEVQQVRPILSTTTTGDVGRLNLLIPVIGVVVTIIGSFVVGFWTWYLNERSKRSFEEYKRKEEKYSGLIRSLRGFYVGSQSKELKKEFLNQLNLCWMYCPDEIIRKAYNFLFMVNTDQIHPDEDKEKALAELILAIRKDLIIRKPLTSSDLKPEDFKHLGAT